MPRTNQISAIALGIGLAPWISMGQSLLGQSANDSPTSGSGAIVASNGQGGGAESAVASGGAESGPQVVALVNGMPIPRERLAEECLRRHGAMVLDDLLDKMLVLQACQAQNLVITKEDVNDEIARQATKFKLNTKMFLQLLEEERGVKPERYAADIVWPMLAMRQLARDKIQVTQEEIDRAYQYEFGPSVKVRMIAVKDEEKAKQIHQQVAMDPSEFKRLAKQESTDQSSASVEGLLPPIRKNSGDDLIEHMAFQLKPDEVSEIFQVANQYVILQCVRHEPATPPHP
ncbi:MAG: peptidylprolyl isomerase, partial [bacterium]